MLTTHENNPVTAATRFSQDLAAEQARQAREFFLDPVFSLQRQMNRMMMDTVKNMPSPLSLWSAPLGKVMPKVSVWEDSDAFYLETKVPGMRIEDIDISVNDNALTITCGSERVEEQAEKGETLYQKHNACRTVMIPDNANSQKIEAEIRDDESLIITMPKKKAAAGKSRKINVKRAV